MHPRLSNSVILMVIWASLALSGCEGEKTAPASPPAPTRPSPLTSAPASAPATIPVSAPAAAPVSGPAAMPASAPAATMALDTNGVTRLPFGGAAPLPGALSISADGRTAAHIGTNSDVVLWDAVDIKPLGTIPSNGKKPSAVALSADGDLVAIGYFDSRVIVWSRRDNKVLRELNGHMGGISALAFEPNGQRLASGGDDATAQIWELSSGKRLRIFDSQFGGSAYGGLVVSLGFTGNGRVLVVNEWYSRFYDVDRGTTLWDIEEEIEILTMGVAPPNSDNTMRAGQALGGGGWLLAYTGGEGLIAERLDGCEPPRQLPSGGYADTVAADPQGRWVAASESEQLTFFGMSGNTKGYSVTLPARAIALAGHPDGRSVFALMIAETQRNGNEHFIIGRDAETVTGSALYRIPVPEPLWRLPTLAVKADASHCAPTEAARMKQDFKSPEKPLKLRVIVKSVPTREMTSAPESPTGEYEHSNPPRKLYFAKDGSLVRDDDNEVNSTFANDRDTGYSCLNAGRYFECYGADRRHLKDLPTSGTVTAFAARNGRLAALYSDGRIQVWSLKAGGKSKTSMLLPTQEENGGCGDTAFELSGDGNYVQIACDQGPDAPTGYAIFSISTAKAVAEGPLLAPFPRQSSRGVVQDVRPHQLAVWDFGKGEIIARLPRHSSRDKNGTYKPLRAAISHDGRLVASASFDGSVRVWDVDTRQLVGEASVGGEVTAMVFDSAGRRLAAGRADGQLIELQIPKPTSEAIRPGPLTSEANRSCEAKSQS